MNRNFYPKLAETISNLPIDDISENRMPAIEEMTKFISLKLQKGEEVSLNFICTHNSRRSQFSQIWAQTAADYYGIPTKCYSGGVEVTAFNERAVQAIERDGFKVSKKGINNPVYTVRRGDNSAPIFTFSKIYDDKSNPQTGFAAVMTCDHADENCPFIPGADARIAFRFEDPKAFDDTELEGKMYTERSHQIGAELFLIFKKVKESI